MEYCEHGSLKKVIYDNFKITKETFCDLGRQIAGGMNYLHTNKFIHYDLKPDQ